MEEFPHIALRRGAVGKSKNSRHTQKWPIAKCTTAIARDSQIFGTRQINLYDRRHHLFTCFFLL
jgi:hypothetical protein